MVSQDATDAMIEPFDDRRGERKPMAQGPPPFVPEPPNVADHDDRDDEDRDRLRLSNARLGMLLFLAAETMLFAGLTGAFLMYRLTNPTWPPPMLPRLPVLITGVNTLILLYSAVTMWQAQRVIRAGDPQQGGRLVLLTWLLGVVFLVVQGFEWVRLVRFGLTMASGVYGAAFYTLIGCHGLHVVGAVIWLLGVLRRTFAGRYQTTADVGLAICGMYWYYVVGLWPILYGLVYLY